MQKRKRKSQAADAVGTVLAFAEVVDALFLRYTGKTIPAWLKEPQERPKELPAGEKTVASAEDMSLADAYGILGLKLGASLEDVKKHYRNLAYLFHPDRGGYGEAMILLNRAYARIMKEKADR